MRGPRREQLRRGLRVLVTDPRRFWRVVRRMARPIPREYRHWRRITLYDWMIYHEREVAPGACRWMGLPAFKNPLDAWIYQEIIWEVRPEAIIEIGSAHGGSTLYLAHLLDMLGRGEVISVDRDRSAFRASHPRIVTVTGHSSAPETVAAVARRCSGKSALVIHDGDHSCGQVLSDLAAYAPLVSLNSYYIVEDGIIDLFGPNDGIGAVSDGPLAAVEQFLRQDDRFESDRSRERYLLTYNPRGFLRRVR